MAFWHRGRAKRLTPRVKSWGKGAGVQGFPAYKAGMTHALVVQDDASPFKGQEVIWPVTILETPNAFVYGVTAWEKTPYGLKAIAEVDAKTHPKQLTRVLTPTKKEKTFEELKKFEGRIAELRLLCFTQPWKIGLKKNPDVFELSIGGSVADKLVLAEKFLGKELGVKDVFQGGETVDTIAITKGKGWQGVVKRYGVSLNIRKASKSRRHGGSIGPERQAKVMYTIPRAGQMGFQKRTERNKRVVTVSDDSKVLPVFDNYGIVKGPFIAIRGSVQGPVKRFVLLRKPLFPKVQAKAVDVKKLPAL
nr:50S ribosomal protein L3P [uncultured archaeon]